jgi:hypothetical protein
MKYQTGGIMADFKGKKKIILIIAGVLVFFGIIGSLTGRADQKKAETPPGPITASISLDFAVQDGGFYMHNTSGQDLTDVMISLDVWKDDNIDSTFIFRTDRFKEGESLTVTEWTKVAGGRSTSGESLPGPEYKIKTFYLTCNEGDFEAELQP